DQFQVVGDNLLLNGQVNHKWTHWTVSNKYIQSGLVRVENKRLFVSSDSSSLTISQVLSVPEGKYIRVSANAAVADVVAGEKGWQKARVYFVSQVDGKKFWGEKHHLLSVAESHDWTFYQEEFPVHASAEKLFIGIQMPKGGGTFILDDITVTVVEKAPQFYYLSRFLMLFWTLALVWGVYPLLSGIQGRFVLVGGLSVLILMVVPQEIKIEITSAVSDIVKNELPAISIIELQKADSGFTQLVSKAGHFLVFFLFTFMVALFRKGLDLKAFLLLSG
ncbi:MAG: hypothetical protein GY699_02960, partial [Desulfobacteraceae bacterium]|nr:hypothetical protein [Desulfobacteraceae bacterium]